MTALPDIVEVHSETLRLPEGDELIASIRNAADGSPVMAGGLRKVHGWLTDNGYEWVTASNGLWRLASRVKRTSREDWR